MADEPDLSLFELLAHGERVLVHADEEERVIYTWNQSVTLQVWTECTRAGRFVETNFAPNPAGGWALVQRAAKAYVERKGLGAYVYNSALPTAIEGGVWSLYAQRPGERAKRYEIPRAELLGRHFS